MGESSRSGSQTLGEHPTLRRYEEILPTVDDVLKLYLKWGFHQSELGNSPELLLCSLLTRGYTGINV